jgi:hypothetical protein
VVDYPSLNFNSYLSNLPNLNGGCSLMVERTVVVRVTRVQFPPSAFREKKRFARCLFGASAFREKRGLPDYPIRASAFSKKGTIK